MLDVKAFRVKQHFSFMDVLYLFQNQNVIVCINDAECLL